MNDVSRAFLQRRTGCDGRLQQPLITPALIGLMFSSMLSFPRSSASIEI